MEYSDIITNRITFPFTAIVGLDKAKLALLVVAVNPSIGGVLLRGDKGTGKTTLVRALANVLPEIDVVANCPFNCNPYNPFEMCDNCYSRWKKGERLPVRKKKMRVVDLPLSITPDRLIGTIDFEKALKEGKRVLRPGLLAEANRNILYIDEVNLLDDYIADLILDAAAYGWNIIEREHVSFKHPARFILIGSMNPEEGELRPQLLDRFGIVVDVEAPRDPSIRAEIVRRVEEFHANPLEFYKRYEESEKQLTQKIIEARKLLPKVVVDDDLLMLVAKTMVELGIRTCRAEITTIKTAKAIAALNGRTRTILEDIKKALELTLPHRLRLQPLSKHQHKHLDKVIEEALGRNIHDEARGQRGQSSLNTSNHRVQDISGRNGENKHSSLGEKSLIVPPASSDSRFTLNNSFDKAHIREVSDIRGSRSKYVTVINKSYGVPITYIYPWRSPEDIDIVGTIVNMLVSKPDYEYAGMLDKGLAELLAVRVRRRRIPVLTIIAIDTSGSMNIAKRIAIAKAVAQQIIEREYTKKTWLSLIAFRSNGIDKYIPPTKNYTRVYSEIEHLRSGGRTPLPLCLQKIVEVAKAFKAKHKEALVKTIMITDGRANKPIYSSIEEEITQLSSQIAKQGIELIIYEPANELTPGKTYIDLIASLTNAKVYKV